MEELNVGNEKNILFYNDEEGNIKVEVLLENEDVWLNIEAISKLFNIGRSGIVKHINNIYKDEELNENITCAKIAHMGNNGKQSYKTNSIMQLQVKQPQKSSITELMLIKTIWDLPIGKNHQTVKY